MATQLECRGLVEVEVRGVYLLDRSLAIYSKSVSLVRRGSLPPGPHLSPLTLEAANALLSPLSSHLDCSRVRLSSAMMRATVDGDLPVNPQMSLRVGREKEDGDFREGK